MNFLLVLAASALALADSFCPSNTPASCNGGSASCCYEKDGLILQTQFWDVGRGPSDKFTLHGLWSDKCDGSFETFCDSSMELNGQSVGDIIGSYDQGLLNSIQKVWLNNNGNNEELWEHEYNKHGTCFNTIKPSCYSNFQDNEEVYDYFKAAYNLWSKLDTYSFLSRAGITPSNSKTYTKKAISNALNSAFGREVYFKCRGSTLSEIWYFHNLKGSLRGQNFIPVDSLNNPSCPNSGIKLPTKY